MSATILFEIGWKSVLVAGTVLALLYLLKGRSAAERSTVAHAGLLALIVLPLTIVAGPTMIVEPSAPLAEAIHRAQAPFIPDSAATHAAAVPDASARSGATEVGTLLGRNALWLTYSIPALALLVLALLAVYRLHKLRLRATILVDQDWLTALAQAQRRMGFPYGTALLSSSEVASPVSWGVLRPVIVLSEDAAEAASNAEAIIAHELAHVIRFDWAKLLLGRAATAILWFNPLVWLLVRQCHQLREEAADDAVLESGVPDADYAALLVSTARHQNGAWLLAANGVAPGRGSLERRVTRVLNTSAHRASSRAIWSGACALVAIMFAAPLAAMELAPITRADAARAAGFTTLELHGRGHVTLRHGTEPQVRLVRGNSELTNLAIDDQRLVINACTTSCLGYEPEIEIVTPRLHRLTVEGGGAVQSQGSFPDQPFLSATVVNGGLIRVGGIEAQRVTATISGGGTIKTTVRDDLQALIRGEGSIVYWGQPTVASSVVGGGLVVGADD